MIGRVNHVAIATPDPVQAGLCRERRSVTPRLGARSSVLPFSQLATVSADPHIWAVASLRNRPSSGAPLLEVLAKGLGVSE
jgi:hypothetical protein